MSKETPLYLTKQLISYMGNKRKIVPYLEDIIVDIKQKLNVDKLICFDGFSGSGVVSRLLKEHSSILVANDIEPYAETLNRCYLANRSDICEAQIKHYIDLANNPDIRKKYKSYKGIIRQNYCPKKSSKIEPKERVFYTIRNGEIIDAIRNFIKIEISPEYRVYILAQLIVKSSVHSNTCGLFNGFYKKDGVGHYGGKNSNDLNRICKNTCLQKDMKTKSNISPLDIIKYNDSLKEKLFITDTFKNNEIMIFLIVK